jgi:hypothetical protein
VDCNPNGRCRTSSAFPIMGVGDMNADLGHGWSPGDGIRPSPYDLGATDLPPGYVWPM